MPLSLGLTGMDPATESELQSAFTDANARLGSRWQLLPDSQADYVIVDMDSMYGPMSWLRLHAAGKQVIGLTDAPRTQADFRLAQPFDSDSMGELLQAMASHAGEELGHAAPPAGMTPAPQPQDELPEELPHALVEEDDAPVEPGSAAAGSLLPDLAMPENPSAMPPAANISAPASASGESAEAVATGTVSADAQPSTLAEWISSGKLGGRLRYRRDGAAVLLDTKARQYFAGATTLKPLAPLFQGSVAESDFEPVEEADWSRETAEIGAPQPLQRLIWFGALLAGGGQLVAGFDPEGRYHMLKWPQTEREYPKHFRVATAMMKGPATIDEIAQASGVPAPDVADFVNANLATGFADAFHEPEPEVEPSKPSGLFGRLRGR
ncbi:hypothetical protein [Lysobacter sp. D1-1-M9]|uniref:hypothetical protein n=1 Tax=Novilysobacter longmucuonensis TaxID=3098603 RepID=UPI002FCA63B4